MNISAISNCSFDGKAIKKQCEKGPNGEWGFYTRDGGNDVFFTPVQIVLEEPVIECYEEGPNGEKGFWTRDGGGMAFFTPIDQNKKSIEKNLNREELQKDYENRKKGSSEWLI